MIRDFLVGTVWGGIAGAIGLAMLSIATPLPTIPVFPMPTTGSLGKEATRSDVPLPSAKGTEAKPDVLSANGMSTAEMPVTVPPSMPEAAKTALAPTIRSESPVALVLPDIGKNLDAPAPEAPSILMGDPEMIPPPADGITSLPVELSPPMAKTADATMSVLVPETSAANAGSASMAGAEATTTMQPPPADLPPILRYAAEFSNPSNKPLFALLLIDDGAAEIDRAELAALPFALTFVVDPLAPNARETAAIYRSGGKEVVMLATGLKPGSSDSKLRGAFQEFATALPESVAVIVPIEDGFQGDLPTAGLVVQIVKEEGRGLLTYDQGANAAGQVARREGLPSTTIFRKLDAEGEDSSVIRRYLDRAVFKAEQEGRVMVIGTASPETVAAILEWTIEGRASLVALAPATAVMTTN